MVNGGFGGAGGNIVSVCKLTVADLIVKKRNNKMHKDKYVHM